MAAIPEMEIIVSFPEIVTEHYVLAVLKERITQAGSLRKFAATVGLSPAFISKVMRQESPVSPDLAEKLGYERQVSFKKL